jgi:hypothetical protein
MGCRVTPDDGAGGRSFADLVESLAAKDHVVIGIEAGGEVGLAVADAAGKERISPSMQPNVVTGPLVTDQAGKSRIDMSTQADFPARPAPSKRIAGMRARCCRRRMALLTANTTFPDLVRPTLAGRAMYSMQFGDVPFFSLSILSFNTLDESGLGSRNTLRGYKQDRFIAKGAALVNGEARWSISDGGYLWGQHLRPILVPFIDTGRVFNGVDLQLTNWKTSYGLAFRLAWNLATVASFELGVSPEEQIFYMDLQHKF